MNVSWHNFGRKKLLILNENSETVIFLVLSKLNSNNQYYRNTLKEKTSV